MAAVSVLVVVFFVCIDRAASQCTTKYCEDEDKSQLLTMVSHNFAQIERLQLQLVEYEERLHSMEEERSANGTYYCRVVVAMVMSSCC